MSINSMRLTGPVSFLLFIACCVSCTYWSTQWIAPAAREIMPQPLPQIDPGLAAGLFGQQSQAAQGRFLLMGVVAAEHEDDSVAIVSADGKPAQALQIGNEVQNAVRLLEIHPAYVVLSAGGGNLRVPLQESTIRTSAPAVPATAVTDETHNDGAQETYIVVRGEGANAGTQSFEKGMSPPMPPAGQHE